MTQQIVRFTGGRAQAARTVRSLIASLTGHERTEAAKGVFLVMGMSLLSSIQGDFVTKARGGVGEDGNRWPRLSPKTLAYSRRFGPGEKSQLKKAAGLGRANRLAPGGKDGLLTAAQLKRWRKIYAGLLARFAVRMDIGSAKAKAAAIAWATIKREGAMTKLEVFGNRPHEPLRDTGVLLNSLSVGTFSGGTYMAPRLDGGEHQIFELNDRGVTVGTNVPYAGSHNYGDKKRGVPARPFIPPPDKVPDVWLERMLGAGMGAVGEAVRQSLQRGGVA